MFFWLFLFFSFCLFVFSRFYFFGIPYNPYYANWLSVVLGDLYYNVWGNEIYRTIFITFVISIVALILWEWKTATKLMISKDKEWGKKYYNSKLMYYHLNVNNRTFLWFFSRKPAMSCKVELRVYKKNWSEIVLHENDKDNEVKFYARWRFDPEPTLLVPIRNRLPISNCRYWNRITSLYPSRDDYEELPDLAKIYTLLEKDIYTHECQPITILIKHRDDNNAYMFNNESFFQLHNDYKCDSFRLSDPIYFLVAKALYGKSPHYFSFKIKNKGEKYTDLEIGRIYFYRSRKWACLSFRWIGKKVKSIPNPFRRVRTAS